MESVIPERWVEEERDRHQVQTGRWCWEVYDAISGGPIRCGVESTREKADIRSKAALDIATSNYCNYKNI